MRRWDVVVGIINEKKMKTFAEVGVCKGETAYPVAMHCPSLEKYYLIDPKFAPQFWGNTLIAPKGMNKYAILKKEFPVFDLMEMTSEDAAPLIPDGSLDGCFIDALHYDPYISQDIDLWTPKVRPGGVICGHDYENRRFPDVKAAVDKKYGVENVATISVRMCKVWIYHVPEVG